MSRDRVRETTNTSGTGTTITLNGPVTGYRSAADGVGDGNSDYFEIVDGAAWEQVYATVSAGSPDTIEIQEVIDNSNGDTNPINLSGNESQVFVTFPGTPAKARDAIKSLGQHKVQSMRALKIL